MASLWALVQEAVISLAVQLVESVSSGVLPLHLLRDTTTAAGWLFKLCIAVRQGVADACHAGSQRTHCARAELCLHYAAQSFVHLASHLWFPVFAGASRLP